jgi:hypothetical protein
MKQVHQRLIRMVVVHNHNDQKSLSVLKNINYLKHIKYFAFGTIIHFVIILLFINHLSIYEINLCNLTLLTDHHGLLSESL